MSSQDYDHDAIRSMLLNIGNQLTLEGQAKAQRVCGNLKGSS